MLVLKQVPGILNGRLFCTMTLDLYCFGTAFQNCLQFLIGIDSMNNGKKHEAGLNNTESKEPGNTGGHSERSEKRNNKDHGVQKVKVLLESFVLELSTDGS